MKRLLSLINNTIPNTILTLHGLLFFMAIAGVVHANDTRVTLNSGILTITDINGGSSNDSLTLSYSGSTYTLTDSGGLTINTSISGSSGNGTATVTVPGSGVTGVNFNLLAGNDSITVSSVQSSFSSDFTISSGSGDDSVTIDADIATTSTAAINITVSNNIVLNGSGSLLTTNGGITLVANNGGTATGDAAGILTKSGSSIATTGTGNISLTGYGLDDSSSGGHAGIQNFGTISSTASGASAGTITLTGFGGEGTNLNDGVQVRANITSVDGDISITGSVTDIVSGYLNFGVKVQSATVSSIGTDSNAATITINGTGPTTGSSNNSGVRVEGSSGKVYSIVGDIQITGTGGNGGNSPGVQLMSGGQVLSAGTGATAATITVTGTGTSNSNSGVEIDDAGSQISTVDGSLSIDGTGTTGNASGVRLTGDVGSSGGITSSGSGSITVTGTPNGSGSSFRQQSGTVGGSSATGDITLNGDTFDLDSGSIQSSGALTIEPETSGTTIGLGGGSGTLNLDDAELALLIDGFSSITIGNSNSGAVDINSASFTDPVTVYGSSIDSDGSSGITLTDTVAPTVTVNIIDTSLNDTDNSSNVTFSFSENVTGFTQSDLIVAGGSISSFSFTDGSSSGSATFTASDNSTITGSVTVNANSYSDTSNTGSSGNDTVTVDTVNPTVTVNIVDGSLSDTDNSSNVTFNFSENVTGFTSSDLTVTGGSISGFSFSDGSSSGSATFTANDNATTAGSITVNANSYIDTVGNTGASSNDTVTIDTVNPTVAVNIVNTLLSDSNNSSNVTFNFSESVTGFTFSDLTVTGGSISGFSFSNGSNSGSATFTATDGSTATGSVTVNANSYTDAVGNNGASGNDTVSVDTVNPTVAVNIVDASLNDSDNNSNVTFSFSENVTGFTQSDLTLAGGSISSFSFSDGSNAGSAIFTASDNASTTGSVVVNAGSYIDSVGNSGVTGNDTVTVDTQNPTVTVNIVDTALNDSDNSSNVTFNFSENITGFTQSDLTLAGGSISGFSFTDASNSGSAIFTATDASTTTGSVSVNAGSYTDIVGNTGGTGSDTATVDTANPTITTTHISISGASGVGGVFKPSDTITATWNNTATGDNNSDIASVSVDFSAFGGGIATAATESAGTWTATYTITAGSIDSTNLNVSVTATDNAGNSTTTTDTTNASVDSQVPTVTDANITISGNTGLGGAFKVGDTVTATWNNTGGGDNNNDITSVTVDFNHFGGSSVIASNSSDTWTATYIITTGSIDNTNLNVSVTATDNAGNTTTTADTTNVSIDNQAPTVTDTNIAISGNTGLGGAFKIGDTVTATWNNTGSGDNNTDTISGVIVNFSAFGGGAAITAMASAGTWTATYTIMAGSIDNTNLNVSVTVTDNAGNTTTIADTTNATLDNTALTVTDANITISGGSGSGGTYKPGDTVTATWDNTAGGDNNTDTISTVTINFSAFGGGTAIVATESAGTWTATYTITAGSIDGTNLNVSVIATDNAGNITTTTDSSNAAVDNIAPTMTDDNISISGGLGVGGAYKIGDTVTATWDNTATGDNNADTISTVTVNFSAFGGETAIVATESAGTWTATYTIVAGSIDTTNLNIAITATDNAGNSTTTSDTTNATVDNIALTVTDANIAILGASGTGGAFKLGDVVTATWNNTAAGDNNTDAISTVTANFSTFGGGAAIAATESVGTWTATYTIVAGSIDGTNLNIAVTATDNTGNATTITDATNATVDNQAPTVTDANIAISGASGSGGAFKLGDTITATWDNTGSGDNNADIVSVSVDFSAFGGNSAVAASSSSKTWTATYTIVAGSVDATNLNIAVTAADNVGNVTSTVDTTNATVDNIAPTVTDTNISISGATGTGSVFKIGDMVTMTWDNTAGGDNNTDINSVIVDFSSFGGGAAIAASNSSETWTATYTIIAGSIDSMNLNVAVTAIDNAANTSSTTDSTNAMVDNQAPTVTDANISLSGGTGTGGAFIFNDTVTATWNNTADNNADIVSVSVDFSALGGGSFVTATESAGTWTATYIISETSISGNNLNVSVTATDDAANTTTTADTSNTTVNKASLVINELDYDQGATDNAEFIEIKNISGNPIDLGAGGYSVQLINSDGLSDYQTFGLSGTLADGDYYVLCDATTKVFNCDQAVSLGDGFINDGSPNAIAIVKSSNIVDTVSYEGGTPNSFTETATAPTDDGTAFLVGLSRTTDGTDTDNNSADFGLRCVTPGGANNLTASNNCFQISINDPVAIIEGDSGTQTINFTVSLSHAANSNVTVDYATADATATITGGDYVSNTGSVTFPANSKAAQTISIVVNGDEIDEGTSETLNVNLSNPSVNAQLSTSLSGTGTITDDDSASFTLSKTIAAVSEPATTDTFTVVLGTQPETDVVLDISSDTLSASTVSPSSLTFTSNDWNTAQTVTITAVDDVQKDGIQSSIVTVSVNTGSSNDRFDTLSAQTVAVTTADDDIPGISVSPSSLSVTEPNSSTNFVIRLNTQPTGGNDVSINNVTTSNSECRVSPASATISNADWNTGVSFTVTAIDDNEVEGTHGCTINIGNSSSSDTDYDNLDPSDMTVTIIDNDTGDGKSPYIPLDYYLLSVAGSQAHIRSNLGGIDCEYGEGTCSVSIKRGETVKLELVKIKTAAGLNQDDYIIEWYGDDDCSDQIVEIYDVVNCAVRVYGKPSVDYSAGNATSATGSDSANSTSVTNQLEFLNFSGHSALRGNAEDVFLGFILEGSGTADVILHADVLENGVLPQLDFNEVIVSDQGIYGQLLNRHQHSESFTSEQTVGEGIYTIQMSSLGTKGRGQAAITLKNNQLKLSSLSIRGYLKDYLVLNFIVGGEGSQKVQVKPLVLSGDVETELYLLNLTTQQTLASEDTDGGTITEVSAGAYAILLQAVAGEGIGMIEIDLVQ